MTQITRVIVAALFSVVITGAVEAACPTSADRTKGFVVVAEESDFAEFVRAGADGLVVSSRRRNRGGRMETSETIYRNGLVAIARTSDDLQIFRDLEEDLKTFLPLAEGKVFTSAITTRVSGKPDRHGEFRLEVLNRATVDIGRCSYAVFVVEATSSYPNDEFVFRQFYAPELGYIIGAFRLSDSRSKQPVSRVTFTRISTEIPPEFTQ